MKFRNFLRPIAGHEAFQGSHSSSLDATLRRRLAALVKRMSLPYPWPGPATAGRPAWENPNLPAGYTYLAQLVAHDCVFTSRPTGILTNVGVGLNSRRNQVLSLETIYGDGPDGALGPYMSPPSGSSVRNAFVLSRAAIKGAEAGTCPFRDIGRAQPHLNNAPNDAGLSTPLVADPRNDIHAVAAQVAMLFQALHNKVLHDVHHELASVKSPSLDVERYRHYFVARYLCQNTYRLILRNDLLPRLLHPSVLAHYSTSNPRFLDPRPLEEFPVEFAQVFRFGHAMVRPFYTINDQKPGGEELIDMMMTTSTLRPWRMPLDQTWMVQWSHFFEMGANKPQLSRRISPESSAALMSVELFGPLDETEGVGLTYRDMLAGAYSNVWSVNALAAELRERAPSLAKQSELLWDDGYRRHALTSYLSSQRAVTGFDDDDIAALANDPPLAFYAMFEAAHEAHGLRLGMLGSLIVADTLYSALNQRVLPHFAGPDDLEHSFEDVARVVYGDPRLGNKIKVCAPSIKTMPDLVGFLAEDFAGAEQAVPFI